LKEGYQVIQRSTYLKENQTINHTFRPPNFVATIASLRRPSSALPSTSSETWLLYDSAVSKKFTPNSKHLSTIAFDT